MKTIYAITKYTKDAGHSYYKFFENEENAKNELKELSKTYQCVKWNKYGDFITSTAYWAIKQIAVY